MCPACARDLARKNIEEASPSGASGNHIADAGKMVASGAGTKPWCPNCEDRDPHCMACAGEGHKRKSSGEPSGSAEIRFVMGGNVYGRPTATDALDYADDRLQDPEEMQCCLTDARVKHMNAVRELLAGVTPEPAGNDAKGEAHSRLMRALYEWKNAGGSVDEVADSVRQMAEACNTPTKGENHD